MSENESEGQGAAETAEDIKPQKSLMTVGPKGLALTTLEELYRFAKYVATSGFAPKGMEKPESILVAVQMGMEVGLSPMQAIQNIAVINGRPVIWGDAAKGLVLSSPHCVDVIETSEGEFPKPEYRAICVAKRRGKTDIRHEFSMADAQRAGLLDKPIWKQYPRRMLQMRARSWALRDQFTDVLKGLAIAEEVRDFIETTAAEVVSTDPVPDPKPQPGTRARAAAKREPASAVPQEPKPELDGGLFEREPGQEG